MNSDDYFDDDINAEMLQELDALERPQQEPVKNKPQASLEPEDSFTDFNFDIDETELQRLDEFIKDSYEGKADPVAGPSKLVRAHSRGTVQTNLFGEIASVNNAAKPKSNASGGTLQRVRSNPKNPFGQASKKTKQWDQTAFAKTGLKRGKSKGKGKAILGDNGEEDEEDEELEFEQFPAPFVSLGPPPPMKLECDLLEAKQWIYPLNKPKRDYQFNIVKRCLFDNTLVALPTGLGKTFIAGVVMLNFYRWFPEGKVVFVAPTKPLVAQQIEACHQTCGIPGSDAAELTGQNVKAQRAKAWVEKRVFYMTPQTLLNDLTSENCDVRNIVLLVVDEAHKGTGDYAYAQVIRFMMAKNPHFRVLALTATPGSNPEAVQAIVDSLHISHIEIRDENSLDLKQYIFKKTIKQHIVAMDDDVNQVKEPLLRLMDSTSKRLRSSGILYSNGNLENMHPFFPQSLMQRLKGGQKWALGTLSKLSMLCRAMGYLMEGTMGMCYTYLKELSIKDDDGKSKFADDPNFKAALTELEIRKIRGFPVHPKMELLKNLVIQHFGGRIDDNSDKASEESKVIVFVTFREAVDEVVEALNAEKPLIRATKFVGQGTDKQGKRGFAQKEQLEVIKQFKAGIHNVLVSTSIGEEGLDIGEIDLIVCYDAQKTPIRMLQRIGRTGRKREGFVHVLLAEGREELNFDKAKDAYKCVQNAIVKGEQLELYSDVERLIPAHMKPECLMKEMEIIEYTRDDSKKSRKNTSPGASPKKRKRNEDITRNMPQGTITGFVTASKLVPKGSAKKRKVVEKDFEAAGQDDETDLELEAGLNQLRRAATTDAVIEAPKAKARRTATMAGSKKSRKGSRSTKKVSIEDPPLSRFLQKGVDDSDDEDIEKGIEMAEKSSMPKPKPRRKPSSSQSLSSPLSRKSSPFQRLSSPEIFKEPSIIELSSSPVKFSQQEHILRTPSPISRLPDFLSPNDSNAGNKSMAWLVDDSDDELGIQIRRSSPAFDDDDELALPIVSDEITKEYSVPISQLGSRTENLTYPGNKRPLEPDLSVEITEGRVLSPVKRKKIAHTVVESSASSSRLSTPPTDSPPKAASSHTAPPAEEKGVRRSAGSGASSSRLSTPPSDHPAVASSSHSSPPIRSFGAKKRVLITTSPETSSSPGQPPLSHRNLARHDTDPVPEKPKRNFKKPRRPLVPKFRNRLLDAEAVHSGGEVSSGSDGEPAEDESDRQFLQELPATQASQSYQQTQAYRQGLLTFVPTAGPAFVRSPVRKGVFGYGRDKRQRPVVSSSPTREEPDDYDFDSFVVEDGEELLYTNSPFKF